MKDQEIVGMGSAHTAAKEMPYGSNMTISAALVIEMAEHIVKLEAYMQKVQADRINDIAKERKRWGREDLKALAICDLEQTRKGFWLGFEDARCHPDEMNILKQWEGTKAFNQAKSLAESKP